METVLCAPLAGSTVNDLKLSLLPVLSTVMRARRQGAEDRDADAPRAWASGSGLSECGPQQGRSRYGRQSRFRKDLANLNKAVQKWLKQEARGELQRSEVEARIRSSAPTAHLREAHGADFQERDFIRDVLTRAARPLALLRGG
mmetsp:Transcript_54027/g.167225  ORF Transcript_54027/g.167225 Transcript_54027/m.167225 type:complete len:144 (+) Transcript_54027:438-869(+)